MASYKIEVAKKVRKNFQNIPKNDALRILQAIEHLAEDPRPAGAKKLKGEELYRIRIGVYRVIYEILEDTLIITVVKVGHRKDIYKK
jgi:mRNA interferase RelE/StbE